MVRFGRKQRERESDRFKIFGGGREGEEDGENFVFFSADFLLCSSDYERVFEKLMEEYRRNGTIIGYRAGAPCNKSELWSLSPIHFTVLFHFHFTVFVIVN